MSVASSTTRMVGISGDATGTADGGDGAWRHPRSIPSTLGCRPCGWSGTAVASGCRRPRAIGCLAVVRAVPMVVRGTCLGPAARTVPPASSGPGGASEDADHEREDQEAEQEAKERKA